VHYTGTGADAIENTWFQQFDMLVLDIGLPDINGFNVAEVILDKQKMAVLVSSANTYPIQMNKIKHHPNCVLCDFHLKGENLIKTMESFKNKLHSIKEAKKISIEASVNDEASNYYFASSGRQNSQSDIT